jgi:16S rRNA (adenine1518-N6/adenine1519-N6)-dimethyltransferase
MHRNYSQYRKRFSQNFLNSVGVVKKICALARIEGETVLEIGAGKGILTRELARRAAKVYAVELDQTLAQKLAGLNLPQVEVVNADFLKLDLAGYGQPIIIGNLPYAITARILEILARQKEAFTRAILTVQREYGDKVLARPGGPNYDPMTVFANYHFTAQKGFIIPAKYFSPRPRVSSMTLVLEKNKPEINPENEGKFFDFVKGVFRYRRKQVKNALMHYLGEVPDKIDRELLPKRPEQLSMGEFYEIFKRLRTDR